MTYLPLDLAFKPTPKFQGELLLKCPTDLSKRAKIEVDDSNLLRRAKDSLPSIVTYLNNKELLSLYNISKVMQHCLNEANCRPPAAIVYEPSFWSSNIYSVNEFLNMVQSLILNKGLRVDLLDLSRCSKGLESFALHSKSFARCLKGLKEINLSKVEETHLQNVPGHLSAYCEFIDIRPDAQILDQDRIWNVTPKELLEGFRLFPELKTLSLKYQILDYRMREAFKKELKGIQVTL